MTDRFDVKIRGSGNARVFESRDNTTVLRLAAQAEADGLDEEERARMIQNGMKAAAQVVQRDAKRRVRVKTGALRRSIRVEAPKTVRVYRTRRKFDNKQADFARIRVRSKIWYVIEFGRKASKFKAYGPYTGENRYHSAPAYPFLLPALETTQREQFERCIIVARNTWQNIADRKRRG